MPAATHSKAKSWLGFGANPLRIDLPKPVGITKVGVDDFIVLQGKNAKKAFNKLERIPLFLSEGISASELLQKEIAPLIWIVPDLLPAGLTFLAGKPKIGKSWFVLKLVVSVAAGIRVFEYYDYSNSLEIEVLYLALEDSEARMKSRINKIAPNFSNSEGAKRAFFHFSWPSYDQGGLLALERWLEQQPP